ncbi:DNA topoisomerase 3-beta-1-like isoform X3 [Lycorma delicatula]|uniref:DNA topoisomerase 3-beta-1-like isoform X3 n=1 Tax=Lycorma delicatula TaxID=130591 RepID=UPI003F510EA5
MSVQTADGREVNLDWNRVRCFEKDISTMFLHRVREHTTAVVSSVVLKEKTKSRPIALNTVELMRVASSGLGLGPHHAMQVAEKLYTQGYISYPRTETTHYPDSFDLIIIMGANGSWLLVVLLMGAVGAADDWSNCPSVCRCKWVSGKKVAECSNAALTTVPDGLSSEIQSIDLSGS